MNGDLLDKRAISTATGAQLDGLGQILDVNRRAGQSDADYRADLQGRANALKKSGEPGALLLACRTLWNATSVTLEEYPIATAQITAHVVNDPVDAGFDAQVKAVMDKVGAGGVQLILQVSESPPFLLGDSANADANGDISASSNGLGDSDDADVNGDIAPGVGGGNLARATV